MSFLFSFLPNGLGGELIKGLASVRNMREVIKEFKRKFFPEADLEVIDSRSNEVVLLFKGPMAYSCCSHDYLEDFLIILDQKEPGWSVDEFEEVVVESKRFLLLKLVNNRAKLLDEIKRLKFSVGEIVKERMEEFREIRAKGEKEIFKELCFCLLTANFSAERSIRIQEEIGDGFILWSEDKLRKELKRLGHRYPEKRAEYIVKARESLGYLGNLINSGRSGKEIREELVKRIKGLGYKESSHFLRNIGFEDVAIIDRHILNVLRDYDLIREIPRSLTRRRYLQIEKILERIAEEGGLSLGELDLYLWYTKTGKILK